MPRQVSARGLLFKLLVSVVWVALTLGVLQMGERVGVENARKVSAEWVRNETVWPGEWVDVTPCPGRDVNVFADLGTVELATAVDGVLSSVFETSDFSASQVFSVPPRTKRLYLQVLEAECQKPTLDRIWNISSSMFVVTDGVDSVVIPCEYRSPVALPFRGSIVVSQMVGARTRRIPLAQFEVIRIQTAPVPLETQTGHNVTMESKGTRIFARSNFKEDEEQQRTLVVQHRLPDADWFLTQNAIAKKVCATFALLGGIFTLWSTWTTRKPSE